MSIFALVFVSSMLVALARGGRLENLATLRVRYIWLFFVPLALQLAVFSPMGNLARIDDALDRYVYFASHLLVALALWLNRTIPGVKWIALGFVLNFVVISLNGGFMPVSNSAMAFAGLPLLTERDGHAIPMTDATLLPFLGDILPMPAGLPITKVFSVGDIIIMLGGIILTQKVLVKPSPSDKSSSD